MVHGVPDYTALIFVFYLRKQLNSVDGIKSSCRRAFYHRRRKRGKAEGDKCPHNSEKYFSGYYRVKFGHFSGKYHVKFGNFVIFSGKYHKNSDILIFFGQYHDYNSGMLLIFYS